MSDAYSQRCPERHFGAHPAFDWPCTYDAVGTTEFTYDGDGTEVELTWDPNAALPMPVAVDDGVTVYEFTWGTTGSPAWATVDNGTAAVLQVPHTDQVWNPTVFTDATGARTHEVPVAAWGNSLTVASMVPFAPSPTVGHSSTLAAASAAGLVHMRARDYDPTTGQFLTPDPWQRPDGQPWVGVHAYTDGDPVSFWDPAGLRQQRGTAGRQLGGMVGEQCRDWGTLTAGVVNIGYGTSKVVGGVPLMVGGAGASTTGIAAVLGVPAAVAGAYSVVTGGARAIRGTGQVGDTLAGLPAGSGPNGCGFGDHVERFARGLVPAWGGSLLDSLGGLP